MSVAPGIDLQTIETLTGGKLGRHDVACPLCGPARRSSVNQRRRVLRIWQHEPEFATFCCARCGEGGHIRDGSTPRVDRAVIAKAQAEAAEHARLSEAERVRAARWLWSQRRPIKGSIAEKYLREVRGYAGPLPATLGYLPPRDNYEPAMIGAFGVPSEPEPGQLVIADSAVRGVHFTRLAADGSGKAGTDRNKFMRGLASGSPIVLAPPYDLLGLAITEGIEDALSVHAVTGLGVWAAGDASKMPAVAAAVPDYIDCVTVFEDDDDAGRRFAPELVAQLRDRGFSVRLLKVGTSQ